MRTYLMITAMTDIGEIFWNDIITRYISIRMASIDITLIVVDIEEPRLDNISAGIQSGAAITGPFHAVDESIKPARSKVGVLVHDVVAVIEIINFIRNYNSVILLDVVEVCIRLYRFAGKVCSLSCDIREPQCVLVIAFKRRTQQP